MRSVERDHPRRPFIMWSARSIGVAGPAIATGLVAGWFGDLRLTIAVAAAFLLLGAVPLFLTRLDLLLYITVAALPLGSLTRSGGGLLNSGGQLVGAYLAFVWVISKLLEGRLRRPSRTLKLLGLFVAMVAVAALVGPDPSAGLGALGRYYAPYYLLIVIVDDLVDDWQKLRRLVVVAVSSLAAVASLSILAAAGVLDLGAEYVVALEGGRRRVATLSGGLGTASFQLIFGLGISLWIARFGRSHSARIAGWAMATLLAVANLMTVTIGGIALMGFVAFLLLASPSRSHSSTRPVRILVVATAGLLLAAAAIETSSSLNYRITSRILEETREQPIYQWGGGRVALWLAGAALVAEHPLGVGGGNPAVRMPDYLTQFPDVRRDFESIHADEPNGKPTIEIHNTPLTALAEAGWIGGGALIFAAVDAVRRARRTERLVDRQHSSLVRFVWVSTAGAFAFALTSDLLADKYFWFTLAVVAVVPRVAARSRDRLAQGSLIGSHPPSGQPMAATSTSALH